VVVLAVAIVIGLAMGVGRRPAGAHATRAHVEHIPLLGVGAVLNGIAALLDGSDAAIALAASLAVLIAVAAANRYITGVAVVGVGLLVNLASVAVNEGMPVRAGALVRAGVVAEGAIATTTFDGARHLESDRDALGVLGDVLPIPITHEVLSFGDLIVVLGAGDAVRELSRRRARVPVVVLRTDYTTTAERALQLWGLAPSPRPVSATQCSENSEVDAPATIDLDKEAAAASSPELVAASHTR
jgi:hypothetical protein